MEAKNISRKTAAESRKTVRELTLLKAIGKVVEVSKESELSEKSMKQMSSELKYLSERFGISEIQALLFCVCMEKGPRHIEFSDFQTTEEKLADVLSAGDLVPKTMFYGCKVQKQVEELQSFLAPEKYKEIRERMRKSGFRTGFACLFYGGPGTGKTETAYQLARETGRDIMVVDVPQIKSKWVGDSEKNIKALFDRYRELVRKETEKGGKAPILLFNEADGIIGIRKQGAQSAVDKMENSIQNIILQEMESLDGIMIATTNLTENLDTAFERRFLYKICFEKPDATVRKRLWMSMMSALSEADAGTLAEKYDFSGGQIENISRKATINVILHGEEGNSLEMLTEYCNAEKLNHNSPKRIGFC